MTDVKRIEENHKSGASPTADLELMYIDEHLREKGHTLRELDTLPENEAERLMTEAAQYASLKLAELEARAQLRTKIRKMEDSH